VPKTKAKTLFEPPQASPKRRHSPNLPEVDVDYFMKSPEVTHQKSEILNDVVLTKSTFVTAATATASPKADITRRSIRPILHDLNTPIRINSENESEENSAEASGESTNEINIKRARGLKKSCAIEAFRNYPVCRRYRLNLKKRVRKSSESGDILADMPVHRYKSYGSISKMAKINSEIIQKFSWIPELLQKVIHNQTTAAVKNSMNTIAKQVLGVGCMYIYIYIYGLTPYM